MPWSDSGAVLSTNESVEIDNQDALRIIGFQPFLTFTDTDPKSKMNMQARVQSANGNLVFFPQGNLNAAEPLVIFNNLSLPPGAQLPSAVEIHAQDALTIVGFQPFLTLTDSNNNAFAMSRIQADNGDLVFYPHSFIAGQSPAVVISSGSGDVAMHGKLTVDKDIRLAGADCAEQFDVRSFTDAEPGTVMVITEDGCLEPSSTPYDRCVAGVVAGAGTQRPGIILGDKPGATGRLPIALVGRAYCKVVDEGGPIAMGDLLTTASLAGYAQKATDPARAFGAVIGKALEPLPSGSGLIRMLIALQ